MDLGWGILKPSKILHFFFDSFTIFRMDSLKMINQSKKSIQRIPFWYLLLRLLLKIIPSFSFPSLTSQFFITFVACGGEGSQGVHENVACPWWKKAGEGEVSWGVSCWLEWYALTHLQDCGLCQPGEMIIATRCVYINLPKPTIFIHFSFYRFWPNKKKTRKQCQQVLPCLELLGTIWQLIFPNSTFPTCDFPQYPIFQQKKTTFTKKVSDLCI